MVSADNVVQCGQATVTWAGTTVCLTYLLRLLILHTLIMPPTSGACSTSFVFHVLSSDLPTIMIHRCPNVSERSYTDIQGPVSLLVGTGGFYANLQPIQTIDNLSGSSTSVEIDQKEGTDMIFKITDSQNKVGYVQNIKVGGGDDSCLSSSSSPSSAAASPEASSSSTAEASYTAESSSKAAPVVVSCRYFRAH